MVEEIANINLQPPLPRIMKLTTISQNVQGLNDASKVELVRNYYRNHLSNIEILCFQEYKLRGTKLAELKGKVWRGAKFFGEEADPAYNNDVDSPGAGSGGVCMWISP
jgi:exonuclease III